MRPYTFKVAPGTTEPVTVEGDFVRVKSASVEVRIISNDGKADITLAEGDGVHLKRFTRLNISHASAAEQTIVLQIGDGTSAVSSRVGGSIQLQVVAGMTQAPASVGVASGQVLAANAARRFLMLQNLSATANIWVNIVGAAASSASGIWIKPGAPLILDICVPDAAIFAISDTAATPLVVIEG